MEQNRLINLEFSILAVFSIFKVFYIIKVDILSNEDKTNINLPNFLKNPILYFQYKSKFDIKYQLNCNRVVFIKRSDLFLKKRTFLELSCILKQI